MHLVPANYTATTKETASSNAQSKDQRQAIGTRSSWSVNSSSAGSYGGGAGSGELATSNRNKNNNNHRNQQQFTVSADSSSNSSGGGGVNGGELTNSLEKTFSESDPLQIGSKTFTPFKSLPINYNNSNNFRWNGVNSGGGLMNFTKQHDDDRRKAVELSTIDLVEQSAVAAGEGKHELALSRAKEAAEGLDFLKTVSMQDKQSLASRNGGAKTVATNQTPAASSPMTRGVSLFELSVMVDSNLAAQLRNCGQLDEAVEVYTRLCKMASSSGSGGGGSAASIISSSQHSSQYDARFLLYRFGIDIGNVYYETGDYQRALKYYRLTLDRLSATGCKSLKIKLMNNISTTLLAMEHYSDAITSLNLLLTDNLSQQQQQLQSKSTSLRPEKEVSLVDACNSNHHRFGLNLMVCLYHRSDLNSMMVTFANLVKVNICHHYERLFDLTNKRSDLPSDEGRASSTSAGSSGSTVRNIVESDGRNRYSSRDQIRAEPTRQSLVGAIGDDNEDDAASVSAYSNSTEHDSEFDHGYSLASYRGNVMASGRSHNRQLDQSTMEDKSKLTKLLLAERAGMRTLTSNTDEDRLEKVIGEKHKQISRCLIMSCNLMLDSNDRATKFHADDDAADETIALDNRPHTSLLGDCLNQLNASESYRTLAFDLRANSVRKMIEGKYKLDEAISVLKEIVSELQADKVTETKKSLKKQITGSNRYGVNKMISQSLAVATYSSLFNLFEQKLEVAKDQCELALRSDPFNVQILINLGNCHYQSNDFQLAETFYQRALLIDPSCWEANYNLVLVYRKLDRNFDDLGPAIKSALINDRSRYTSLLRRKMILSAVQLALIYQKSGQHSKAFSIFEDLRSNTKLAPEIYLLASKLGDESSTDLAKSSALNILQKATDEHPYHIPTCERLIAMSIQSFNYETAKRLLLACITNRPDQVKWFQMLAECHRRAADYNLAISTYKIAIDLFPQDTSCLKALIKLTDEIGLTNDKLAYETKLDKVLGRSRLIDDSKQTFTN